MTTSHQKYEKQFSTVPFNLGTVIDVSNEVHFSLDQIMLQIVAKVDNILLPTILLEYH
jgi:hypothetical protein